MVKKVILGLIAGIICGLFGTGGGMILVPAFIYMLKIEPKKARATSLFCMLVMVIVSSIFYYKNNYIDLEDRSFMCNRRNRRRIFRCKNFEKDT
ncbi:MAG: sulfite exporter TauE/SafE family protein [Clostridia bacterium]